MLDKLREIIKEKYEYWDQSIEDNDLLDFANDLKLAIENSSEFMLYRYVPASYYNIRNLENRIIHLSPNGVMNDIYEGIPCTETDIAFDRLQLLEDLAVMTCFTETNNNTLMWSHYAEQYKGFCIEYDIKRVKKEKALLEHLFPVCYKNKRFIRRDIESLTESHIALKEAIHGDYEYDGSESLEDILPMFLIKGKAWEYEREWRIIYTKKQLYDINESIYYSLNIPFDCISAVYLGYRMEPEKKKNIIEIAQRLNNCGAKLKVYRSTLSEKGYDLVFQQIL
ncbi:MAG: DUF2971 domain-containing protein [Lachnospiraceae bacterium]|nr:DUF2971 domain-containing protein [Lachnospiraceae bacterium]